MAPGSKQLPPKLLEQFQGSYVNPVDAAKLAAGHLFIEIREALGDEVARQIFAIWGTPPSTSRLNEIENMGIVDRLDIEFGGNVKALARQIAGEKFANPTADEIATVERQIRRLNATRKQNPYWPRREG